MQMSVENRQKHFSMMRANCFCFFLLFFLNPAAALKGHTQDYQGSCCNPHLQFFRLSPTIDINLSEVAGGK